MLVKAILPLFYFLTLAYTKDICYGDLGCFTDSYPFSGTLQRPFALLPDTPAKIAVKFTLFNRKQTAGQVVSASSTGNSFDAALPTKFIVHGFLHNANKQWVIDMKNALIFRDDVNVITVDWSKGNGLPYTQATANTQVVGAEIARLISTYISNNGASAKDFHIIGHSLGMLNLKTSF
jgi:pimeloyl-ACP methyl ester carboxylesterase